MNPSREKAGIQLQAEPLRLMTPQPSLSTWIINSSFYMQVFKKYSKKYFLCFPALLPKLFGSVFLSLDLFEYEYLNDMFLRKQAENE